MRQQVEALARHIGIKPACDALRVPRSSLYASRRPRLAHERTPTSSPRALSAKEKADVRRTLDSERFQDQAPREVYATLLDEGTYLCSPRTMYRILAAHAEVRERRDQLRHPPYAKPELLATAPNQVWSWDITKLLGPTKWTYYYLYVMLDIFSRYVVGWLLAERESSNLAELLIREACLKQQIQADQLTLHADRGGPMIAKPVAWLMADLGITKSHSRPHVSNDNPFSEAQFKTMKYRPDYPDRFGSPTDARTWAHAFFPWYNDEHHHSGLGYMTPRAIHYGEAAHLWATRQAALELAYAAHPERFVKGVPRPPALPTAVWINPPKNARVAPAVAAGGVDAVDNSPRSGELSTSPHPNPKGARFA